MGSSTLKALILSKSDKSFLFNETLKKLLDERLLDLEFVGDVDRPRRKAREIEGVKGKAKEWDGWK